MMADDPERMTELSALLAARFAMVAVLVICIVITVSKGFSAPLYAGF